MFLHAPLIPFQSTLPREERPCRCGKLIPQSIFQSTLPREERRTVDDGGCSIFISIHAPTRGATSISNRATKKVLEFQSTLPREERRSMSLSDMGGTNQFQSTLPREERRSLNTGTTSMIVFQSTLPREERHKGGTCSAALVYFNPRSHERSDVLQQIKQHT